MTYNFVKKETPTQVFSCEFFEIFKKTFFIEYLWMIAFEYLNVCRVSFGRSSRSQMFSKVGVLKKFRNIQRKTTVLEFLFNKVEGLQACNFIKRKLNTDVFLWKLRNFDTSGSFWYGEITSSLFHHALFGCFWFGEIMSSLNFQNRFDLSFSIGFLV